MQWTDEEHLKDQQNCDQRIKELAEDIKLVEEKAGRLLDLYLEQKLEESVYKKKQIEFKKPFVSLRAAGLARATMPHRQQNSISVGEPRVELGTSVLSGLRSNQLSYTPASALILTQKTIVLDLGSGY